MLQSWRGCLLLVWGSLLSYTYTQADNHPETFASTEYIQAAREVGLDIFATGNTVLQYVPFDAELTDCLLSSLKHL